MSEQPKERTEAEVNELAGKAEDEARSAGVNLPVSWAVMFVHDCYENLRVAIEKAGHDDMLQELEELYYEIKTGQPMV